MKAIPDINRQIANLNTATAALNAMGATIQSVMILGSKPVIRIARTGFCNKLIENGSASYLQVGHDKHGRYRQGFFERYGCRIVWSESLH